MGLADWLHALDWFWSNVIVFLILTAVMLLIGYIVSKVSQLFVSKSLMNARIDRLLEGTGLKEPLRKLGFHSIADLFALITFWYVFLFFIAMTLSFLDYRDLTDLVIAITAYVPRVVGALVVGIAGVWIGTKVGEKVKESREPDLPVASDTLASVAKRATIFAAAAIALGILGLDTTILVVLVAIVVTVVAIAVVISFGSGGIATAENMSAYAVTSSTLRVGDVVQIDKHRGIVSEITSHGVTLEAKGKKTVIPNATVAKSVVIKRTPSAEVR